MEYLPSLIKIAGRVGQILQNNGKDLIHLKQERQMKIENNKSTNAKRGTGILYSFHRDGGVHK
jgi:hypothetical protein